MSHLPTVTICPACRGASAPGSAFCSHCGGGLASKARSRQALLIGVPIACTVVVAALTLANFSLNRSPVLTAAPPPNGPAAGTSARDTTLPCGHRALTQSQTGAIFSAICEHGHPYTYAQGQWQKTATPMVPF